MKCPLLSTLAHTEKLELERSVNYVPKAADIQNEMGNPLILLKNTSVRTAFLL